VALVLLFGALLNVYSETAAVFPAMRIAGGFEVVSCSKEDAFKQGPTLTD
jgi:hypothetical protein